MAMMISYKAPYERLLFVLNLAQSGLEKRPLGVAITEKYQHSPAGRELTLTSNDGVLGAVRFLSGADVGAVDVVVAIAVLIRLAADPVIQALLVAYKQTFRITESQAAYIGAQTQDVLPAGTERSPLLHQLLEEGYAVLYAKANAIRIRLSLDAQRFRTIKTEELLGLRHPEEVASHRTLVDFPGMDAAVRVFSESQVGKIQEVQSRTQRVQVSEKQLPDIYEIWQECLERAALPVAPVLYIGGPGLEAFSYSVGQTHVVLSGMLVSIMTPQELAFMMSRELGRIQMGLVPHSMLAASSGTLVKIAKVANAVTLGLGGLAASGIRAVVMDWYRKLDFSLDRYGFRMTENEAAAHTALLKLTSAPVKYYDKLNWEAFVAQGQEFLSAGGEASKTIGKIMNLGDVHQWPAVRAAHLDSWVHNRPVLTAPKVTTRCSCGTALAAGDRWCTKCGVARDPQIQLAPPTVRGLPAPLCACGTWMAKEDRWCTNCGTARQPPETTR